MRGAVALQAACVRAPGCFSISATLPSLMESPMDGIWIVMSSHNATVVRRNRAHEPASGDHRGPAISCCRLLQPRVTGVRPSR